MSDLQKLARPALEPLIRGDLYALDLPSQRVLSAWMTMATMVLEFSDLETVAVTQHERDAFRSSRQVLPKWYVWVGRNGGMRSVFYHQALAVLSSTPNVQTTAIGMGKVILHAFSCTAPLPARMLEALGNAMPSVAFRRIWPSEDEGATVPTHAINDFEFLEAGGFLGSVLKRALDNADSRRGP
jgi:hypothetical protein